VYRTMGLRGLQSIENVGVKMGVAVEKLIHELGESSSFSPLAPGKK
jgi:hypothetical protein